MGLIVWIIFILLFLAIVGLGWETFFTGILKGADKIGITPVIKNITDTTKDSLTGVLSDATKDSLTGVLSESSKQPLENTIVYNN